MERTESSRLMRGAREVFYEYILELHDRMDILVGYDVSCTLQQRSIILKSMVMIFSGLYSVRQIM